MKFIKKVGNIKVYAKENGKNDYTISLYNGGDCIYEEIYLSRLNYAINNALEKACDIYEENTLKNMQVVNQKLSDNTFMTVCGDGTGKQDYFCRIDNTNYFQHYCKSDDEFIRDKNGMRIIDR